MLLITQSPLGAELFFCVEASREMLEWCNREMSTKFRESADDDDDEHIARGGVGLLNGMIHDGSCRAQRQRHSFKLKAQRAILLMMKMKLKHNVMGNYSRTPAGGSLVPFLTENT